MLRPILCGSLLAAAWYLIWDNVWAKRAEKIQLNARKISDEVVELIERRPLWEKILFQGEAAKITQDSLWKVYRIDFNNTSVADFWYDGIIDFESENKDSDSLTEIDSTSGQQLEIQEKVLELLQRINDRSL